MKVKIKDLINRKVDRTAMVMIIISSFVLSMLIKEFLDGFLQKEVLHHLIF